MARLARFENGNRWHAIRMGRWTLAELLKYTAAVALLVLFVWNISMLSNIVQPGHPVHMLRMEKDDANRAHAVASAAPVTALERPWFLNPKQYEREVRE